MLCKVRRNLSNISCEDFGRTIADDISAKTVSRCEMKAGACLIAGARKFYEVMLDQVLHKQNSGFSLCFHAYRQDATNGRVKHCALELESAYISNVSAEEGQVLQWGHFTKIKRLSDLVPVGDETGPGCVGITIRSLASLGCPCWRKLTGMQSKEAQLPG